MISRLQRGDIIFITLRLPYHFGKDWYQYKSEVFRFFEGEKIVKRNSKKPHLEEWLIALKRFSKAASKKGANIVISTPTPEFPEVMNKNCRGYD